LPRALVVSLHDLRTDVQRLGALESDLRTLISDHEWEALLHRWDRLLANPCFPDLDPYRNVPWPPF
jgi:predicted component of type VI protein secretion system